MVWKFKSQSRRGYESFRLLTQCLSAMETPPENVSDSEDLRSVTQVNERSKTETGESSDPIPFDLLVDIFLRLPAKSLAICRCVSKRWASILRLPYFTDLFLTRSLARPQLLFACKKDNLVYFFSSPQPQSLDENSSLLTANCYRIKIPYTVPPGFSFSIRFSSIRGLVFIRINRFLKGKGHVSLICNPSTGQSLILPQVKSRRKVGVRSYFGYDPVEKQYKVLSMTWKLYGSRWLPSEEHQVLTLGEPSWRKIECSIPQTLNDKYNHVCIDGVLYYPAEMSNGNFIIVCFDVRSEKFWFLKDTDTYTQWFRCASLINYNGKLASLRSEETIDGRWIRIRLRVLEDVEKQVWSVHTYVLSHLWKNVAGETSVRCVGVTRTNEIVLCSSSLQYLLYYNTERNKIIRVDIQGMEAFKHSPVFTLLDHVEDVKLMEVF